MGATSVTVPLAWRVAEEDRQRLAGVFERVAPALYRYAVVRLGGDTHLAEDFMQQLWVQALDASSMVPTPELEYWLRAIMTNLIRTHWRKQARRPAHLPLARPEVARELAEQLRAGGLSPEWLERDETRNQLLLAITSLPADEQELIVAFYFEGASQHDLAGRLACSPRAVEGRLYRARKALRERLAKLIEA